MDLGSKNIHLVCGYYKNGSLEVKQSLSQSTPEGVIKDGKIEDINTLKGTIKNMLTANKVKGKNTVLTIQSTSIITRDLILPTVKMSELENMVKFEIEQYLPIVTSEYVIEYTFMEEVVEDNIKKSKIQVAAMPKNMVENYLNLLKEVGLKPTALDVHSNTVVKIFSNPMTINRDSYTLDKTLAFIDLGYMSINIHIISKGKLVFSRIITLGAKELDTEISTSCNLTLRQAEEKKIKEANLELRDYEQSPSESFNDLIRTKLDVWMSEIQKVFQYYISRGTGNRIESIYIYGGSSKIKGLSRYIEHSLNIKTSKIENLSIIKESNNLIDFNQSDYINALGGLIRYE